MSGNNWSLFTSIALSIGATSIAFESAKAVTFAPPSTPAPSQSTGGASRDGGRCLKDPTAGVSFTPLMPTTNNGLTVAERPTFFVYFPETHAKQVFFSLQDEDGNSYYQTTLSAPIVPGIVGVKLPDSAPALQVGKNYKWSLAIICDRELEPDSPGVDGWVRRVESDKEVAVSLDSVLNLAKGGIWYDAVSTLVQLKQSQPENSALSGHWKELLESVGLNAIAREPLVER